MRNGGTSNCSAVGVVAIMVWHVGCGTVGLRQRWIVTSVVATGYELVV